MIGSEAINESTLAISRELDSLKTLSHSCRQTGMHRIAAQIDSSILEIVTQLNRIDDAVEIESLIDRFSVANR